MLRAALGVRRMNPKALESEDHLMNRGCGDLEVFLEVGVQPGACGGVTGNVGRSAASGKAAHSPSMNLTM